MASEHITRKATPCYAAPLAHAEARLVSADIKGPLLAGYPVSVTVMGDVPEPCGREGKLQVCMSLVYQYEVRDITLIKLLLQLRLYVGDAYHATMGIATEQLAKALRRAKEVAGLFGHDTKYGWPVFRSEKQCSIYCPDPSGVLQIDTQSSPTTLSLDDAHVLFGDAIIRDDHLHIGEPPQNLSDRKYVSWVSTGPVHANLASAARPSGCQRWRTKSGMTRVTQAPMLDWTTLCRRNSEDALSLYD
jgi:hypothetical protein